MRPRLRHMPLPGDLRFRFWMWRLRRQARREWRETIETRVVESLVAIRAIADHLGVATDEPVIRVRGGGAGDVAVPAPAPGESHLRIIR